MEPLKQGAQNKDIRLTCVMKEGKEAPKVFSLNGRRVDLDDPTKKTTIRISGGGSIEAVKVDASLFGLCGTLYAHRAKGSTRPDGREAVEFYPGNPHGDLSMFRFVQPTMDKNDIEFVEIETAKREGWGTLLTPYVKTHEPWHWSVEPINRLLHTRFGRTYGDTPPPGDSHIFTPDQLAPNFHLDGPHSLRSWWNEQMWGGRMSLQARGGVPYRTPDTVFPSQTVLEDLISKVDPDIDGNTVRAIAVKMGEYKSDPELRDLVQAFAANARQWGKIGVNGEDYTLEAQQMLGQIQEWEPELAESSSYGIGTPSVSSLVASTPPVLTAPPPEIADTIHFIFSAFPDLSDHEKAAIQEKAIQYLVTDESGNNSRAHHKFVGTFIDWVGKTRPKLAGKADHELARSFERYIDRGMAKVAGTTRPSPFIPIPEVQLYSMSMIKSNVLPLFKREALPTVGGGNCFYDSIAKTHNALAASPGTEGPKYIFEKAGGKTLTHQDARRKMFKRLDGREDMYALQSNGQFSGTKSSKYNALNAQFKNDLKTNNTWGDARHAALLAMETERPVMVLSTGGGLDIFWIGKDGESNPVLQYEHVLDINDLPSTRPDIIELGKSPETIVLLNDAGQHWEGTKIV